MVSKETDIFQKQESVTTLIDQVIWTLQQHFPDVVILEDESEDAGSSPYFLVLLKEVSQKQELGRRYFRQYTFELCYGRTEQLNRDLHVMAESLYDVMEWVSMEKGQLRGTGMYHKVVEGKLHFYVDYSFHVVREAQKELKMQELKQEGYVHG